MVNGIYWNNAVRRASYNVSLTPYNLFCNVILRMSHNTMVDLWNLLSRVPGHQIQYAHGIIFPNIYVLFLWNGFCPAQAEISSLKMLIIDGVRIIIYLIPLMNGLCFTFCLWRLPSSSHTPPFNGSHEVMAQFLIFLSVNNPTVTWLLPGCFDFNVFPFRAAISNKGNKNFPSTSSLSQDKQDKAITVKHVWADIDTMIVFL